jgi:hypothetical protein
VVESGAINEDVFCLRNVQKHFTSGKCLLLLDGRHMSAGSELQSRHVSEVMCSPPPHRTHRDATSVQDLLTYCHQDDRTASVCIEIFNRYAELCSSVTTGQRPTAPPLSLDQFLAELAAASIILRPLSPCRESLSFCEALRSPVKQQARTPAG